ncbi:MAG: Rieske (2Fe-2S) protein [Phycisphaeraceae bacterium]|nr:Rieske (2Fe-2S) protein [Phycisphaeraceae bacterium]
MATWTPLGKASDFPPGTQVGLTVGDKPLVLINLDGQFVVISNVCPHAGMPLEDGEVRHGKITCPYHGYTFCLDTGRNADFPNDEPPVRKYPTRVENGELQVQIEA